MNFRMLRKNIRTAFLIITNLFFIQMTYSQKNQSASSMKISFELDSNTTATYEEVIAFYQALDDQFETCKLFTYGETDFGKPLHLLVLSKNKTFDPAVAHAQNQLVLLINNGIHPGEPEGIDASMMLARNLLTSNTLPDNTIICILPVYNIGGMHQRGQSRANQEGPAAYGFRGNARNFDLNRDFVKTDTRNSRSFQEIFHTWKPTVFMDTHTSNGADYQYVMTLIETQNDKLTPALSPIAKRLTQELYAKMEKSEYPMIPYVSFRGRTPESGIVSFLDGPRYSTGYTAMHHTIGYMPETHMLKPYVDRVKSTYALLTHFIESNSTLAKELIQAKKVAIESVKTQKTFALNYSLDTNKYDIIDFLGYESGTKPSEVSGAPRLFYDRNQPFKKEIKFYNRYQTSQSVDKPAAYLIPQAWSAVIDLLKLNGVEMERLASDTTLQVEMYYITDYQTARAPYEGHYNHSQVQVRKEMQTIQFYQGDYLIHMNQAANRYIIETLEPQAPDSFFNWNFFDSVLSKKEHFSAYIFEDEAAQMLRENPALKAALEAAKLKDEQLKNNAQAQLTWVHNQSKYVEKTYMRYPIARIL